MYQSCEKGDKSNFEPNFGPFGTHLGRQCFFKKLVIRHYSKLFKGKLVNQTCENGKKYNFGSNFGTNLAIDVFKKKQLMIQTQ